ncbi:MAG: DUF2752 domain-containing protein [Desulfobacterales bacterium]|jgi:hypothetical protein
MEANHSIKSAASNPLFTPILAPVMQSRWIIALLGAITLFQVALTALELPAWQCPLKVTLGIACPGCGLTRAMVLLAEGDWLAAVQLHAFAPVGLGIGLLLVVSILLPAKWRHRVSERLAVFEKRSGIMLWLIFGLLIYWIGRLTIHIYA